MKSSLPTEWLSQDGWNNVKYTSQSLFLLDKPDLQAKNIALMTSQYQVSNFWMVRRACHG
jgi:hypothetical protein